MGKTMMEIIKEVSKLYNVELQKVEKEEDAGIFIEIDNKKVNVSELDNDTIFDNIFDFGNEIFDYKLVEDSKAKVKFNKKINITTKNNQDFNFDYHFDKRKVA